MTFSSYLFKTDFYNTNYDGNYSYSPSYTNFSTSFLDGSRFSWQPSFDYNLSSFRASSDYFFNTDYRFSLSSLKEKPLFSFANSSGYSSYSLGLGKTSTLGFGKYSLPSLRSDSFSLDSYSVPTSKYQRFNLGGVGKSKFNYSSVSTKKYNVSGFGKIKGDDAFETAFEYILEREGGYANVKHDKGGKTNYGITHKTYSAWLKKNNLPMKDVKDITMDEVRQIYYDEFWKRMGCDELPSKVALLVFDIGVHSGVGVGLDYVKHYKNGKTINEMLAMRERQYLNIVQNDPTQAKFKKSWLNRLSALEDTLMVA